MVKFYGSLLITLTLYQGVVKLIQIPALYYRAGGAELEGYKIGDFTTKKFELLDAQYHNVLGTSALVDCAPNTVYAHISEGEQIP